MNGDAGKKIYESTKQLRERNKGMDVMAAGLDNNQFYDRFLQDLNDIELINSRVERDVEFRIQQRINKFGQDGKKILGIHIHVPVEKQIKPFEKYSQANMERENKIKQDLYYT